MSTSLKVIGLLTAAGWVLQCFVIQTIWTATSVPAVTIGSMLLTCVMLVGAILCVREAKPTWAGTTFLVLVIAILLQWFIGGQIDNSSRIRQDSVEKEDTR